MWKSCVNWKGISARTPYVSLFLLANLQSLRLILINWTEKKKKIFGRHGVRNFFGNVAGANRWVRQSGRLRKRDKMRVREQVSPGSFMSSHVFNTSWMVDQSTRDFVSKFLGRYIFLRWRSILSFFKVGTFLIITILPLLFFHYPKIVFFFVLKFSKA